LQLRELSPPGTSHDAAVGQAFLDKVGALLESSR
jgi:hypothetical protein